MVEIVYISGKYTAPTREKVEENIQRAIVAGVRIMEEGKVPLIPHSMYHPMVDITNFGWKDYMRADVELLKRCDSIYMLSEWRNSRGAKIEHWLSKRWGKRIYYE